MDVPKRTVEHRIKGIGNVPLGMILKTLDIFLTSKFRWIVVWIIFDC